jgi:hypothetical protein
MSSREQEISRGGTVEGKLREFKGDIDIFVPRTQEQQYLSRHGIEIRHLSNGITIAGATRRVEDGVSARIEESFASGAYHEPAGKRGINHLLEHLIAIKPFYVATHNEANFNGFTNSESLVIFIDGKANPNVRDYGVWPALSVVNSQLVGPLNISQADLENEKNVVVSEMYYRNSDHNSPVRTIFNEIVFSKTNPKNYKTIGTEDELRSITLDDIGVCFDSIVVPKGLDIGVYTEGNPEITVSLMDQIENDLKNMPRQDKEPTIVDENLYGELNPDFKQGGVYAKDTGLRNNDAVISYLWVVPSTPFSVYDFATARFFDVANQKMFRFFRESGIGYACNPINAQIGQKRLIGFQMHIPKREKPQDFAKSLYPDIKSRVFGTFSSDDIDHINNVTHKRLKAIPITVGERLNDARYGQRHYGRIIDTDRLPEIHKMITPNHLEQALEQFTSVDPAIVVVGDLS